MIKFSISFILLAGLLSSYVSHIIKITNTTITQSKEVLLIETKLFSDDLSVTLSGLENRKISLEKRALDSLDHVLIYNYILRNLEISINDEPLSLELSNISSDFENEDNVVIISTLKSVKKVKIKTGDQITITNNLLFESIPEQTNLVTFVNLLLDETKMLKFENDQVKKIKTIYY